MNKSGKVLVAGGGPAGMMAAWTLSEHMDVYLFEKEKMLGRKFLLAGKGGFNLTNRISGDELTSKYSPAGFLNEALSQFDGHRFRKWLLSLGIPTFEGSSGRVFPEKGISPAQVLDKITESLKIRGVQIFLKHTLESFNDHMEFTFLSPQGQLTRNADYAVLAMGGASWPSTGSDGKWVKMFLEKNIQTLKFEPSNCGVNINWPDSVKQFHTGKPLKNILLSVKDRLSRGEALITDYGLEGNAVYPLIPEIRKILSAGEVPAISVDFKPVNTPEQLELKISASPVKSTRYADIYNLNSTSMAVIKAFSDKESFIRPDRFILQLKNLHIPVESLRPVDEAISTVGGLSTEELNPDFSLKKYPSVYCVGEMADWDAPTGGFLLQGSFSMGFLAAHAILQREKLPENS
ncbi:MAG: NAD(P)/FAD-dependent oxidoreductase [Lentimicrobium sp.]